MSLFAVSCCGIRLIGLQVRVKRNSLQDNDSMEVVSLTVEFSKTETNVTVFLKLLVMLLPTDVETDYVSKFECVLHHALCSAMCFYCVASFLQCSYPCMA